MEFIAKCTKCGEKLHLDPTQKEAVCPHCSTPFIFERTTFNSEMADQAKLKSELVKKYDEKISGLREEIVRHEAKKDELQGRVNRRSILGKSSKHALQDEIALIDAKITTAEHEIETAEIKKQELFSNA
ncbi:MAG: hypothetical protein LBC82_01585 [Oscillospiraceae bacterium]|jgi:DNA-directed RNA polymerase subunit RPC12/RpoP|nr:hypothetical protein [Oscillospiraceae bacterium]